MHIDCAIWHIVENDGIYKNNQPNQNYYTCKFPAFCIHKLHPLQLRLVSNIWEICHIIPRKIWSVTHLVLFSNLYLGHRQTSWWIIVFHGSEFNSLRPSICAGKPTIIGSDNGLSPNRRQAIIWTNAGILLIAPLGTNFNEILTGIQTFSFKKMHFKMSSAKWRPFCLGLDVLTHNS